jgi:hypothetical protein
MGIAAKAPDGGIVAQIGGQSRPLILTNAEIERFEVQHAPVGIFEVMAQMIGQGYPQARHCRDLVALGLVGAGVPDMQADKLLNDMPPSDLIRIRSLAQELLFAAFAPPPGKKKDGLAGSSRKRTPRTTTSPAKSEAPSQPD